MSEIVNVRIARRLEEAAALLHEQGANPYRVQAYRHAAATLRALDRPASAILEAQGEQGLRELPGVGESIARFIRTVIETGRLPMLDRLRGESEPELLLATVPGIGRKSAERLHRELHIDTLEELEAAANDGRLAKRLGLGPKRLAGIIDSLATRLARVRGPVPAGPVGEPGVAELLDVDREYRERGAEGTLRRIAPRRFNPAHEAWLPVLHTTRRERHYTALFSNTARAHEMNATRDWVVLYSDGAGGERQCTVITARLGPLRGKRIVRGREAECARFYRGLEIAAGRARAGGAA
jgi:hypothetical protein